MATKRKAKAKKNHDCLGYSKLQYEKLSEQSGYPSRCPAVTDCERASGTRWLLSRQGTKEYSSYIYDMTVGKGRALSFEDIDETDYQLNPHLGIIHNTSNPKEFLVEISNSCPEVMFNKFGVFARWYKEYKDFSINGSLKKSYNDSEGKHFTDCSEFSKWCMVNNIPLRQKAKLIRNYPEEKLQEYITLNIEALEPGLKFVKQQKFIATGALDIVAKDKLGEDVIVELKAKHLSSSAADRLCGQVSRYYNEYKDTSPNPRLFIVVPRHDKNKIYSLYQGLKHWVVGNRIRIFQFDHSNNEYYFEEVAFVRQ